MCAFQPSDRPERSPKAQLLFPDGGGIVVVHGDETWNLQGVDRARLERLLAQVDGSRSVQEICESLDDDPASTAQLLEVLRGPVLRAGEPRADDRDPGSASPRGPTALRVAVLANGRLGEAILEELLPLASLDPVLIEVQAFASCQAASFLRRAEAIAPAPGEAPPPPSGVASRAIDLATRADLGRILGPFDLVVGALEGVRYRAFLDLAEVALAAGQPCLLARIDGDEIVVGPTLLGTQGACFGCSILGTALATYPDRAQAAEFVPLLAAQRLASGPLPAAAARQVRDEIRRLGVDPLLVGRLLRLSAQGESLIAVEPEPGCPFCRRDAEPAAPEPTPTLARQSHVSISLNRDRRAEAEVRGAHSDTDTPYRTVGILGGGTAGYLTALALRTRRPELEVTLIESSQIPIIGVGEATTPRLLDFLHSRSGLDVVDFHRRVRPTWKLGIDFFWGLPGDYRFRGAFQFASLLEPMVYRGDLETYSLGCALMETDRVPVFVNPDGSLTSFLHRVAYAYHLDNRRFVRYLTEEATRLGVERLDRIIVDAEVSAHGEDVECLVDDGGERHRFDLYVDASGFRSVLLGKALDTPFIDYDSSLFTDSALVGDVPQNGVVKPYTTAQTMDSGWCWSIPFEGSDHRGYVFASSFCTPEQARDEMRRKHPGLSSEPKLIRFRSGRRTEFWRGNVVAVGNAYAFVEPLESTGLEMLTIELDLLVDHFPSSRHDRGIKQALSTKLGRMWDDLRGLLAIHYKFNRKLDTEFWRECRDHTDLATAEARVALFADRAPLSHSRALLRADDPVSDFFSQDYIYDVLLCGQQAPGRYLRPFESRAAFERRRQHYRQAASWAIPQAEALQMLRENPEPLTSVFENPESWIRLRRY